MTHTLIAPSSPPGIDPPAAPRGIDLARDPLPANLRPGAELGVLDITKWFGEQSGGVKTYLTEKARYVAADPRHRQVLVIPGAHDAVTVTPGVTTYRLRGPRIPTQTHYRFLLAPRTTRRIFQHERPHLIEVGSPLFVPWVTRVAARGLGIPLVTFYHTSLPGTLASLGVAAGKGRLWRQLIGAYARRLDALFARTIVASEAAARELEGMGVANTARVPLGVDLERFYPARKAQRESTLRRLGLPTDRPIGLYVGRLAAEKRLDVLLDAWVNVERACGAHLVIAGGGAQEDALKARCIARQVSWLPYQHDREMVARLHAAADIYVSPGDVETFGLSALEALASGTPVAASAAGAVAELVTASRAGQVFEPGSPGDCARAIRQLLASEPAMLRLRARAYAEREHDWGIVFDRLFTLYRTVRDEAPGLHS